MPLAPLVTTHVADEELDCINDSRDWLTTANFWLLKMTTQVTPNVTVSSTLAARVTIPEVGYPTPPPATSPSSDSGSSDNTPRPFGPLAPQVTRVAPITPLDRSDHWLHK